MLARDRCGHYGPINREQVRSISRKSADPLFRICWTCLYDFSMYGILRKAVPVAVLVAVLVFMTSALRSQQSASSRQAEVQSETGDQVRIGALEDRVRRLDSVPSDIAVIKQQIINLKEQADSRDSKDWAIFLLIGSVFLERMLDAFGIRLRKGRAD